MNILITGGLGYIGSHLACLINTKKYRVFIIDNLSNSKITTFKKINAINPNIKDFTKIDLKNEIKLINYLKIKKIDLVIHLAGLKSVPASFSKSKEYYENNILGSANLIKGMKKNNINKLIFSSSATVYSSNINSSISEKNKIQPNNIYGFTKKTVEDLISLNSKLFDLNYIILRYFNPAGCHSNKILGEETIGIPNNLFPYIGQIISKKKKFLKIYGKNYKTRDGTGARDYIYIEDLIDAHIKSIEILNKKNIQEFVNIGSGKLITVKQVLDEFYKSCRIKIKHKYFPKRSGDIDSLYTDIKKSKKILNWRPKKNISDICKSVYFYYNNEKNN
tara:strand:+ start:4663 stop:5664 length:1002 start_codon:yes stop_codon:yes gene_type:complete